MSSRENIAGAYNLIIEDEDNGGNVTQSPVQLREGNRAEFPHELASSGSFVSEDNTPLGSSTETTGTTYSILKIRKRTKLSEENDMKNRVTWSEGKSTCIIDTIIDSAWNLSMRAPLKCEQLYTQDTFVVTPFNK